MVLERLAVVKSGYINIMYTFRNYVRVNNNYVCTVVVRRWDGNDISTKNLL